MREWVAGTIMGLLGLVLGAASSAQAATYYVATTGSGTTCSVVAPCGSLQTGIGKLSAGDTLYLHGGTYAQRIHPADFHIPSGTDWNTPITIAGYPNETARLTGGVAIQDNLDSSIVSYLIFDHLTVQNTGNPALFLGGQSHHVRLQNSDLQAFGNTGSPHIVFISSGTDSHEILSSRLHDAPVSQFLSNDPTTTANYGCYCYGRHMLIDGNIFYNNTGYAIHHYHSGDPNVSNNVIRNNIIYGNGYDDGSRALVLCAVIMTSGSNNYFYNNLVYGNKCGVQIGGTSGNFVYNNTITGNTGLGLQLDTLTVNLTLRNNILYGNGDGSPGNQLADFGSTNTTQDHNLLTDPLFTNPGANNFTLQAGSPAVNAGVTVAAVTTDITGLPRPQDGVYDLGAYERAGGTTPPPVPTAFRVGSIN